MVETQNSYLERDLALDAADASQFNLSSAEQAVDNADSGADGADDILNKRETAALNKFEKMQEKTEELGAIKTELEQIQKIESELPTATNYRDALTQEVNKLNEYYSIMNNFVTNPTMVTNYRDIKAGVKNPDKVNELIRSVNANEGRFEKALADARAGAERFKTVSELVLESAAHQETMAKLHEQELQIQLQNVTIEQLQLENQKLDQENTELNGQLEALQGRKEKLEGELSIASELSERLRGQVADMRYSNENIKRRLRQLEDDIAENGRSL